jgi:hypothetical protein
MMDDPDAFGNESRKRIVELERDLAACREERNRYREALEWIAADNLHGGHLATDANEYMYGNAARKALKGERK